MAFSQSLAHLMVICFLVLMPCTTQACRDPDYLPTLKNMVSCFYNFYEEPSVTGLSTQNACARNQGTQIARPRWSVSTFGSWPSQDSTCPWYSHVNEDNHGLRYPCRISEARLVGATASSWSQTCLRVPGIRHFRFEGKLCQPLEQAVPVVVNTGCNNGTRDYAVRNISITVGYTCTFQSPPDHS